MSSACETQNTRPVIFSGPMVRAILDGRKSQTRRIIPLPVWAADATRVENVGPWFHFYADHPKGKCGEKKCGCIGSRNEKQPSTWTVTCPYGVAGDRLWVRETWRPLMDQSRGFDKQRYAYRADHPDPSPFRGTWKPSIHMPRAASRITLEITKVRVERLQDISEEDARAEGVEPLQLIPRGVLGLKSTEKLTWKLPYTELWDLLHGKGAWEKNPWVWIIEFRRLP